MNLDVVVPNSVRKNCGKVTIREGILDGQRGRQTSPRAPPNKYHCYRNDFFQLLVESKMGFMFLDGNKHGNFLRFKGMKYCL